MNHHQALLRHCQASIRQHQHTRCSLTHSLTRTLTHLEALFARHRFESMRSKGTQCNCHASTGPQVGGLGTWVREGTAVIKGGCSTWANEISIMREESHTSLRVGTNGYMQVIPSRPSLARPGTSVRRAGAGVQRSRGGEWVGATTRV